MLLNNGRRPSRAAIYIKTRYSTKLRDYVTLEAAEIAEAMKADLENIDPAEVSEANNTWIGDVYSKHKGPEKKGRVRCIGKRISLSQDIGPSEQRNESAADSRIAELENKLTCLLAAFKQMCPNFSMDDAQVMASNGQMATSSNASGR